MTNKIPACLTLSPPVIRSNKKTTRGSQCPRPRRFTVLFLTVCCLWLCIDPAQASQRVALLIGNASYASEKPLANPVRDAHLLARALKEDLKFDRVTLEENVDRARLIDLIELFQRQATGADAALFYFSGHGMQDGGKRNYLIPVDARIKGEAGIRAYGVQADEVVAALAQAAPGSAWSSLTPAATTPTPAPCGAAARAWRAI